MPTARPAKWRKGDVVTLRLGWAWEYYPKPEPGWISGDVGIWKTELGWYSITHQPSGIGLASRRTLRAAKALAAELMERFDLSVATRKASNDMRAGDDELIAAIRAFTN